MSISLNIQLLHLPYIYFHQCSYTILIIYFIVNAASNTLIFAATNIATLSLLYYETNHQYLLIASIENIENYIYSYIYSQYMYCKYVLQYTRHI